MSATPIIIREERPADHDTVRCINDHAFGQPQEGKLVDALRTNCPEVVSLVAQVEDTVVGHILFSPAVIDREGAALMGMGLAPMAVLPEHQRSGIGTRLVKEGLAILRERACPYVIFLGHPEYYPRFGFLPASGFGVSCIWEVPDPAFMLLKLSPKSLAGVAGLAEYRDEFNAL